MKKEDAKKLAAIIACEMIGCNGDCDNCDKDNVERRRQDIINKLNDKAADCFELAKSFKETTLAEQRELIFDKGKHFDVLERVLAIHEVLDFTRDIELGLLKIFSMLSISIINLSRIGMIILIILLKMI